MAAMNDVNDQPIRAWRDLAHDWKVWLSLALCLLVATVAWLLGYDWPASPITCSAISRSCGRWRCSNR